LHEIILSTLYIFMQEKILTENQFFCIFMQNISCNPQKAYAIKE